MLSQVRIVGAGLIGTSIALALNARGVGVELVDIDASTAALANDLAQGRKLDSPELVVLAVPTEVIPLVIEKEFLLNPNSTFMDVGSIKTEPIVHIKNSSLPLSRFVPTHPMAGREVGGAHSARADLFTTRSWIITPTSECSAESEEIVRELIALVGGSAVVLPAEEHDRAVAAISHLPQITSTLLALSLESAPTEWLDLAGAGLRDTTRIAASDPKLWSEIIYSNREQIVELVQRMHRELGELLENLESKTSIASFIEKGRFERSRIPGKHGGKAREYTYVPIVIDDKPGQLAAIFNECASIAVNVEDLNIEHSPGQQSALITLALSSRDAESLSNHLSAIGWNVHPILK
ncbi:MAG: prephenate dehydrogenase [Candidatus Planktophila sp.]|nr:prephenate dehydrogenase [Candidatus Planktophila sp.]